MAHIVTEKSRANLALGAGFTSTEQAREAQLKSAKKRAENRAIENTIKSIALNMMNSATSDEVKEAFAKVGLQVDTKLANLMAQVITQGLSSKASIKDKLALLDFLGKYTGQEPAQKLQIEDKPIINIDVPR